MTDPSYFGCPYLGIETDAQTRAEPGAVPNFCHRLKRPRLVLLDHQHAYCLATGGMFLACPLYPQKSRLGGLVKKAASSSKSIFLLVVAFILVILTALFVFCIPIFASVSTHAQVPVTSAAVAPVPSNGITNLSQPTIGKKYATVTPSLTPFQPISPTLTSTSRSNGTASPSLTPGPFLETPFGVSPIFLVHRILPGENMTGLVTRYSTSVGAICAANGRARSDTKVLEGSVLVIPVGQSVLSGIPALRPVFINTDMLVQDIATRYQVDVDDFKRINEISGQWVAGARWVVVPLVY